MTYKILNTYLKEGKKGDQKYESGIQVWN